MRIFAIYKRSLHLLERKDRRHVYGAMLAQVLGSLLDLAGVMLIGVVTFVAASSLGSGASQNGGFAKALKLFGLSDRSDSQLLILLSSIAVLLFLTKSVTVPLLLRRVLRFLGRRSAEISRSTAERFFRLPLTSIQKESTQQIAFALGIGVNSAIGETLGAAVVIVAEISLLTMLSTALLIIDPLVTFFTVAYFGLLGVLLQKLLGTWIANNARTRAETEVEGRAAIAELATSYREMFVGNHIGYYVEQFANVRRRATRAQSDWQLISYIPKYFLEGALVVGASLLTAAQFATKDKTSAISTLVFFMAATSRVLPSILRFQGAAATIRASAGTTKFTFEILEQINAYDERKTLASESVPITISSQQTFEPKVVVKDISFGYVSDSKVLDTINLEIQPGTTVAIVGPTGSGKSTLADLMLGVIEADAGSVHISGLKPRDAVRTWPGLIGFVPQVVAMRDASIRENVAMGIMRSQINDDQVWGALDAAELGEYLRSTREGLDTQVGERGIRLSGGQRQRLGLARALYSSPKLLVLDEATSALDSETEATIAHAIAQLGSDVTRITIAHRLATVMNADRVVYLENGRVLAIGTFDEVRLAVPQFDKQASLLGL